MSYIQRRGPLLPGELAKHATLSGLGGTFDDVVNAIGSVVSGSTAAFLKMGAPQYKLVSGVAFATNQPTLDAFKALQTQVNRVLKAKNIAVIAVDGKIGGDTVKAMNAVNGAAAADYTSWQTLQTADQVKYLADLVALTTTADGIAANVLGFYRLVRQYADALAAPPSVASPPPAAPPAYIDIATNKPVNQGAAASALDAWKRMGTGTQLAAVGALGLAAVFMLKPHKRRK